MPVSIELDKLCVMLLETKLDCDVLSKLLKRQNRSGRMRKKGEKG